MQILIAEDEIVSRTLLTALLKKWGYEPIAVENGVDALEAMQSNEMHFAILDWEMPGMSGLEVCQKIRERNKPIPPYLIILTSRGEKKSIVTGLEAGANDYISKPYSTEELLARIRVGQRMIELQINLLKAREALVYEAMHDPLTGAMNRRAILDSMEKELKRAKRTNSTLSIGLCDLDHFKRVNDTYGHQIGDKVLCRFVSIIRKNFRNYDLIGRYGGEEFLVIAPALPDSAEETFYNRLRVQVEQCQLSSDSGNFSITVSIGVAFTKGVTTVDKLIALADAALYEAKAQGRNRVCIAPRSINE